MEDKDKIIIKECYKKMLDVVKINNPEFLIIPNLEFNAIMKKIAYLEESLKNAKKSRDTWKTKFYEKKI